MKFTATGRTGGDETTPYNVTDYASETVSEFVKEVLSSVEEWGYVKVKGKGCVEYRYGQLLTAIPSSWSAMEIESVSARGGWSRMDYLIQPKAENERDFTSAKTKEVILLDNISELDTIKVREKMSVPEIPTPEEYHVIKEVTLNSDVVNNEFCIFFPTPSNMFTLFRYPASSFDLAQTIRDAVKFVDREYFFRPRYVLIPFNVYCEHGRVSISSPEDMPRPTFDYVCKELGLDYRLMVPDRLKTKVIGV